MSALCYLKNAFDQAHPAWQSVLQTPELQTKLLKIDQKLSELANQGQTIFPNADQIFHALQYQAPDNIRVVILGQDPYHGDGEAMGLSFSVPEHIAIPPSLRNIFKELNNDLNLQAPMHGDLTHWAKQGVLLLNSVLTVNKDQAGSHKDLGWQTITQTIIDTVNQASDHCVFLLWGKWAQSLAKQIDTNKHLILQTVHPSPLSAYRGFLGCQHFSQTNTWLTEQGYPAIRWDNV